MGLQPRLRRSRPVSGRQEMGARKARARAGRWPRADLVNGPPWNSHKAAAIRQPFDQRGTREDSAMKQIQAELDPVAHHNREQVSQFLGLGRRYLAELDDTPADVNEKFLHSLLRRLGEDGQRWLILASVGGEPCGFSYSMVDTQDRPGWGFVAEFYVEVRLRRCGVGSQLYDRTQMLLSDAGVRMIWLTTSEAGRPFWESNALCATGEVEENGHEVMVKTL